MDIDDMNNTIIEGIKNAIYKGPDGVVEFASEMYKNSNNDFFLSSRGFAEEVLFRIFEYGIFHMSMSDEVDYSRYVLDNEYRGLVHKKRLESFDDK